MEQHESYHKRVQDLVSGKEVVLEVPELLLPQIDDGIEGLHENENDGERHLIAHESI
jgi:hypothetical protein